MTRRPRCPVCSSKRWHRDGLSGSIVCEEGHLLQGYVQESNETQEMSQHVTMSRRLRKKRAKRVKPLPNHYFHGERATFILWQSLQWVLREQLRVLIEELGWPTELEGVCRDLWAMLMASSGVPNAPSDHFKGDEPASSYCGPREGSRYAKSRKRSTKGKAEDGAEDGDDDQTDRGTGDEGRSEGGRRAGSGSEADADDSHSDVTSDESVAEDSEDDGVEPPDKRARRGSSAGVEEEPSRPSSNIYDKVKPPPVRDIKPQSRNPRAAPRMDHLLMIIYLGCTTLRYPVFLSDIIQQVDLLRIGDRFGPLSPILTLTLRARSLAETHQILYINARAHLPLELQQHLNHESRYLLNPPSVLPSMNTRGGDSLNDLLQLLIKMYAEDWGLKFPEPNLPLLSWRLCRSLALPPLFYSDLKCLFSVLGPTFSLALHPPLLGVKGKSRPTDFVEPPEFVLLAGLVVLCKMVWGLGNEKRVPRDEDDLVGHLPPVEEWLATIGKIAEVEKERDPSFLWSKEVVDMSSTEIDNYLDFFEDKVVPEHLLPKRMKDIDRFFPAPALPNRPSQPDLTPFSDRITNLISALYSLPSPAVPPTAPANAEAPHSYQQYTPSLASTLPTPLHTLLTHASTLVGATPHELLFSLRRLEIRLHSNQPVVVPGSLSAAEYREKVKEAREEVERWREGRWEVEMERRAGLKGVVEAEKERKTREKAKKKGRSKGKEKAVVEGEALVEGEAAGNGKGKGKEKTVVEGEAHVEGQALVEGEAAGKGKSVGKGKATGKPGGASGLKVRRKVVFLSKEFVEDSDEEAGEL